MRPADRACLALVAGVVGYDIASNPGETISEAFDRYLLNNRWATELGLALLYLHVSNKIPARWDPIHRVFCAIKGIPR